MFKPVLKFLFTLAVIALPTMAQAQIVIETRCSTDSLNIPAALQRIEWTRKCGLTTNTGGPSSAFPSTKAIDTNGNPAMEHREIDPNHAYSVPEFDFDVNYTYSFCRFRPTSVYTVSQETSGPTTGFFKWSSTLVRPRPHYPTFESAPFPGNGITLFPLPNQLDDCGLYYIDPTTGQLTRWLGNFYVVGYCTA